MRITETQLRKIMREEAQRLLKENEEMTVQGVIERYKDEGPRSWMRVSNDFHEMAAGGMDDHPRGVLPGSHR